MSKDESLTFGRWSIPDLISTITVLRDGQVMDPQPLALNRRDYGYLITPDGGELDRSRTLSHKPDDSIDVFALSVKAQSIREKNVDTMGLSERHLQPDRYSIPQVRLGNPKTLRSLELITGGVLRDVQHKGGFPRPSVFWLAGWQVIQHKLPESGFQELRVSRAVAGAKVLVLLSPHCRSAELGDGAD